MASCTTSQWVSNAPQVKLVVEQSSSTNTTATLKWTLYYISKYPASTGSSRTYTVTIGGTEITGSYDINGKTGTKTIASSTKTINKTHSSQSISFSISFPFNLTWSGVYGGTKTASGSISVAAKPSYTITYNANGGSGAPSSDTKWYGETLTLSTTKPSHNGYSFSKWNTASGGGGTSYSSGGSYTANSAATLYAQWKANTYTVSYNANGGSGAPANQTKTHGVALTLSTTKPTRTGYTFQGWATSASSTKETYASGASYTEDKAITLYAVWKIKTYTITYNANSGSGAPSKGTKTYGVDYTISSTIPTRTNYKFLGWATSSTSTAVTYKSGSKYTANKSITLYAVWELTYFKPTVLNIKAERCSYNEENGSYAIDDYGTCAKISFTWSCDQNTGTNNVSSITIALGSNSPVPVSASGTYGGVSEVFSDTTFDIDNTYTFTIKVTDSKSGTTTKRVTLPGALFPIDVFAGGRGVSIGAPANSEDFNVHFPSVFHKPVGFLNDENDGSTDPGVMMLTDEVFTVNKRIYALDSSTGDFIDVFNPRNSNKNTVVGFGNYCAKEGDTTVYGHDVNIGVSNIDTPDTYKTNPIMYRPYYRKGDSIYVNFRTSGFVTNSKKDIYFIVPLSKPVIGDPIVTATSIDGFKLRQYNLTYSEPSLPSTYNSSTIASNLSNIYSIVGTYTHGSSSGYAVPSSYTAEICNQGIRLKATFATITNAINNSPIGIDWNGTITFS